jgi:3-polyprenyl-4-hydroxybenzoate decarboxylase
MFTKCIIVVDEDCDVQDFGEVTLRVTNNIDPERDIQFTLGPIDSLDHAQPPAQLRLKMGIDATRKWKPPKASTRPWPAMLEMDRGEIAEQLSRPETLRARSMVLEMANSVHEANRVLNGIYGRQESGLDQEET